MEIQICRGLLLPGTVLWPTAENAEIEPETTAFFQMLTLLRTLDKPDFKLLPRKPEVYDALLVRKPRNDTTRVKLTI